MMRAEEKKELKVFSDVWNEFFYVPVKLTYCLIPEVTDQRHHGSAQWL